ncbi:hypothetical protein CEXT_32081 [Caerostris extrusa]|uniref:Uncharacterized protein n=1 Tax=Caerostris extrusa TaxID=172846 RepID=A0AAV4VFT6_CAEEX|nr:hypothetical protein CEXT_32081 [Caerostris extrusa]
MSSFGALKIKLFLRTLDVKQAVNKNSSEFSRKRGPQGNRVRPSILKAPSPQAMSSSPPTIQTRAHSKKKKGRQKYYCRDKREFKETTTEGHWRLQALMSPIWLPQPSRVFTIF